jgi:hypothetical protein
MFAALLTLTMLATAAPAPPAVPPAPPAAVDAPACVAPRAPIATPAIGERDVQIQLLGELRRTLDSFQELKELKRLKIHKLERKAREDRMLAMPRAEQDLETSEQDEQERDARVDAETAAHREDTFHIDSTWAVPKGMVLKLSNFSGVVLVEGWGRDAVRLEADRDRRDRVRISQSPQLLDLSTLSPMGFAEVDFKVTVPDWMPVLVNSVESDVTVKGIKAAVQASSIRGDVRCTGGSGNRRLSSVEGKVQVADARGDVTAGSIDNDVALENIDGLVQVETVNGDVRLDRIASADVDASSMAGSIVFTGPFQKKGRYRLSSHSGDVTVGVPDGADLDVSVATFNGDFSSVLPAPRPPHARGRRFGFTLGSGGSTLELESYQGLIQLLRPAEVRAHRAPRAPIAPVAPVAPAPPARKGSK